MCLKAKLTPRQWEIADRVVHGDSNPEIAQHFHISESNVKNLIRHSLDRIGLCNRTMLAVAIARHELQCLPCRLDHNSIDIPESLVST